MSNKCIFCKKSNQKTKEHIIPKWLQLYIYGDTNWRYEGVHLNFLYYPKNIRKHTGNELVFGRVCAECNNGWMSQLENDVKPILISIIEDPLKIKTLKKNERFKLSIWSFKTAILLNAGSNYRKIVPIELYEFLYKYKTIPRNVKIDIGTIESKNDSIISIQKNIMFKTTNIENKLFKDFIIALKFDNILIRITWQELTKENKFKIISTDENKSLRIWPYQKNNMFNPLNKYKDLETFSSSITCQNTTCNIVVR